MSKRQRPAPRNWRRRMGTAVLFLLALDAIVLTGPYSLGRVLFAAGVTLAVAVSIALIWVRNTRLERLSAKDGSRPTS